MTVSDTYPAFLLALATAKDKDPIVAHIDSYIMQWHKEKARIAQLEAALREIDHLYGGSAIAKAALAGTSSETGVKSKGPTDCGPDPYPDLP
jgi:hypothetical protein